MAADATVAELGVPSSVCVCEGQEADPRAQAMRRSVWRERALCFLAPDCTAGVGEEGQGVRVAQRSGSLATFIPLLQTKVF